MVENDAYGMTQVSFDCNAKRLDPSIMQARPSDSGQQLVPHDEVQYEEIDPNTTGFTISTNTAYSIVPSL